MLLPYIELYDFLQSNVPWVTPHAFGYSQANISDETVLEILKALFVTDPWAQISLLSGRIGLTGLPLRDAFINASKRRHRAAHVDFFLFTEVNQLSPPDIQV
jgi:hypothetical protein